MKFLRDTWLVFQRQMQLMLRNPVWLVVGIVQPLFYLLLFAPLLKPALGVSTNAEAYKLFVPGLLVLLAMFGSLFTGFGLIAELRAGVIERSRVTPVSRFALLIG
jgi:ABC-2 type transport system permease protein